MKNFIERKCSELIKSMELFSDNSYIKSITSIEIDVLNELSGFDEFIYESKLLVNNIDEYRNYIISKIDKEILEYKKQIISNKIKQAEIIKKIDILKAKNQNNILLNRASKINQNSKEFLKNYQVHNFDSKKINAYNKELEDINNLIQKYNKLIALKQQEKFRVNNTSPQILRKEYKDKNQEKIIKLKEIFDQPLTSTEKAIYKIMQTQNGYKYIKSILDEIRDLEDQKNKIVTTVTYNSQLLNQNIIKYLKNELNITGASIKLNEQQIINLNNILNKKLDELLELKFLLIKFDPNIFLKLSTKYTDNSDFALKLSEKMHLTEKQNPSKEYKNATFIIDYLQDEIKDTYIQRFFSKNKNKKYFEINNKLDEKSLIIINNTEDYIKKLHRQIIFKTYSNFNNNINDIRSLAENHTGYLLDINSFINDLKIIINSLNSAHAVLINKKELINNRIVEKKQTFYLKTDVVSDGEDLSPNIDLYNLYKNAYRKIIASELNNEISENLNIFSQYDNAKSNNSKRLIKIPIYQL